MNRERSEKYQKREEGWTLHRLLDAPSLENNHAKIVSCGARHSAVFPGRSSLEESKDSVGRFHHSWAPRVPFTHMMTVKCSAGDGTSMARSSPLVAPPTTTTVAAAAAATSSSLAALSLSLLLFSSPIFTGRLLHLLHSCRRFQNPNPTFDLLQSLHKPYVRIQTLHSPQLFYNLCLQRTTAELVKMAISNELITMRKIRTLHQICRFSPAPGSALRPSVPSKLPRPLQKQVQKATSRLSLMKGSLKASSTYLCLIKRIQISLVLFRLDDGMRRLDLIRT
ncbi:hypothetical protein ACSBR2_012259 [Camellia fascicularis]